jgi:Ni,Fe-hydrogenase I large subunit
LNEAPRERLATGSILRTQRSRTTRWSSFHMEFRPRCAENIPGPVEHALVNTPVADAERPLEILRTIHSFDPCIACAVCPDRKTARKYQVKVM